MLPWTVTMPLDLNSALPCPFTDTVWPCTSRVDCEVSFTDWPFISSGPVPASTVTPCLPSTSTVPSLCTVTLVPFLSRISWYFPSPVSSVIPSLPLAVSANTSLWPVREKNHRPLTWPLPPSTGSNPGLGGVSTPLCRPASTYGASKSPCSNATSTSSLTSGSITAPRSLPAPICATRAQSVW